MDGPGGIVLSPTRELAVQIFEVLRTVGSYHDFSAGLIVGGKKEFGLEQSRIGQTNIIIATPGRLLQHLEQTPDFDVSALAMLVLDEADRILDMGFRDQMIRILDYLPPGTKRGGDRQTLLFSATQTKKVSDLAALSLNKPEYVGVHDKESTATPESLQQNMIVVPLNHKLDAIFSFIKSHLKKKRSFSSPLVRKFASSGKSFAPCSLVFLSWLSMAKSNKRIAPKFIFSSFKGHTL